MIERHQQEEQDVDALDRVLQEPELLVLLEGLADAAQTRLEPLRHVDADHHRGDDGAILLGVADGHHGLDHVAVVELVDGRDLLAGERLAQVLVVRVAGGDGGGRARVPDVDAARRRALKTVMAATPSRSCCSVRYGRERLAARIGEEPVLLRPRAPCSARGAAPWPPSVW